jgi:hypothetical protein
VVDGRIQVFSLDDFIHEQPKLENGPPEFKTETALIKMRFLLPQGDQLVGVGLQSRGYFRQPVGPNARGDFPGLLIGAVSGYDLVVCLLERCDHGSIPSRGLRPVY